MKSIIVIGLGYVFLCIAVIGIVIPIWPTTPFVLISVACFSSSPNMRKTILRFPFFKEHIENYSNKKGLSKKSPYVAISSILSPFLYISLTSSLKES